MSAKNRINIALTFDLEYWYCGIYLKKYLPENYKSLPEIYPRTVEKILTALQANQAQATFFVLGSLAEENPQLIKKIFDHGHEIAVHGYEHRLITEMSPEEFKADLNKTIKIIKTITGQEPIGYRAPNFFQAQWLKAELKESGIIYDSSSYPTFFKKLYNASSGDIPREYPLATTKLFGINIPTGGGFYFRVIPIMIYRRLLEKVIASDKLPVLYFHPMDLENFIPQIKMPFWLRIIKYWGVKNSFSKFEKLLSRYNFTSLKKIYEQNISNHSRL